MTRSMLGRAAFSAAVALALGFGAREAAAAPEAAARRPYCEDQMDCENICREMYPDRITSGICSSSHTCWCYFRN